MDRPKRYFTTPLGTGRAASLGPNDPRARRDAAARAESVDSPVSSAELAALQAEVAKLKQDMAATASAATAEESAGATAPEDIAADVIHVIPWHATSTNDFIMLNSPIAERIMGGLRYRHVRDFDLTGYTQVRMRATVSVASASLNTPQVELRYKTGANSATESDYLTVGITPVVIGLEAVGHVSSGWVTLDDAAKTDVLLTLIEGGGNGSDDPVLGWLHLEFK